MPKRKRTKSLYLLKEPDWKQLSLLTEPVDQKKAIAHCEYFVHYEIHTKKKQDALINWIKKQSNWSKEDIKYILSIDKGYFSSMGKTAWTAEKLGYWPEGTLEHIHEKCKPQWLQLGKKVFAEKVEKQDKKKDIKVISIQDRMREQVATLCGKWESVLDQFLESENFDLKAFDPYNDMRAHTPAIKPAHAKIIKELFDCEYQEALEVFAWKDEDIKEGYSHFDKKMRKNFLAFFEKINSATDTLIQTGKAQRKPRKPKAINKDKLISKLKFKINDSDLGIASIHPIDILDASEVWVYNTKNRKLGVYKKSPTSIGLTVKGTSIRDFSETSSWQKTLRKPAEQLKLFTGNAKTKYQSAFDDIKATEIKLNGRLNEHIIILKAF